jgi:hypothetical protein
MSEENIISNAINPEISINQNIDQNFTSVYDMNIEPNQLELKKQLYNKLLEQNKSSEAFINIIENYNKLYKKYLDYRLNNSDKDMKNYLYSELEKDQIKSLDKKVLQKSLSKLQEDNRNLKEKFEENQNQYTEQLKKNLEVNDELNKVKNQYQETLQKYNEIKTRFEATDKRCKDLDKISNEQEKIINDLKKKNSKLENDVKKLTESINKLLIDNKLLTNKILSLQNDQMEKINEYNELIESAKQKKKAADMYFNDSQSNFEKNVNKNVPQFMNTSVESVEIPSKLQYKFKFHNKSITSICFNGFGSNLITTGADNFIKIIDTSKNQEAAVFSGFASSVTDACFDRGEQLLFAGSLDKTAKLWNLKNSKLLTTFTGHIDYINAVYNLHTQEKGLTGSSDRTIREWDFNQLKLTRKFNCTSACHSLCVASDDSYILSGHMDGSVRVCTSNEKPDQIIDLHDDNVIRLEILKGENQFLTLSKDFSMKLFDLRKNQAIYTVNDSKIPQYCESQISVSTDKKYFAVGSTKGNIYVINLLDGSLQKTINNKSTNPILSLAWRPFHSQLYVGDNAGYLTIWKS